jgi:hypothetical protein
VSGRLVVLEEYREGGVQGRQREGAGHQGRQCRGDTGGEDIQADGSASSSAAGEASSV